MGLVLRLLSEVTEEKEAALCARTSELGVFGQTIVAEEEQSLVSPLTGQQCDLL